MRFEIQKVKQLHVAAVKQRLRTCGFAGMWVTVKTAMPKSFSEDLKWRVVYMVCLEGKTIQEVSRDMYVSHPTVDQVM